MAGELFMTMAGAKLMHVPYHGLGQAMPDLLGAQVQAIFTATPLAVTSAIRSPLLPDLPTIGDFLPGHEATWLVGLGAPKNVPDGIIDRRNKETNTSLADPGIRTRLADLGGEPLATTLADFGKLLGDEAEKWTKVIRAAGIKSE